MWPTWLTTPRLHLSVNLRTQLTIAFFVLAIVPSAIFSIIAMQRVNLVDGVWESAGFDELLQSSINVSTRSLDRMTYDLEHAAAPLVARWDSGQPDFSSDSTELLYVTRYLEDVGFDFVLVFARSDTGYILVSEIHPEFTGLHPDHLSEEISEHNPEDGLLESSMGAFAFVRDLDTGHRVAVGYLLDEDFFTDLFEVRLGVSMLEAIRENSDTEQRNTIVIIVSILVGMGGLAVFGGWFLSHRLVGPVGELSKQLETMAPGAGLQEATEPRYAAPEVRALTSAFNSLISRLRATQHELLRAERVAGSAMVARHVAHEIKNPLSTLGYATRRLERRLDALPEEEREVARQSLAAMQKEFELLEALAETFSELGRMSGPPVREPFDLNQVVRSVQALYDDGPATFEVDLAQDLPKIQGDEGAFRRVLSNLAKNAVEAQGEGVRITVRTRVEGGSISLGVEDNGPGMDEMVRSHVFDPGFSTKHRGSGVGLFLTRTVVEQHGGTISVDSEPGRGTVFRIELPVSASGSTADS